MRVDLADKAEVVTHSGARVLHLVYPHLPPTENKIRMIRWGRVGRAKKSKPLGMT